MEVTSEGCPHLTATFGNGHGVARASLLEATGLWFNLEGRKPIVACCFDDFHLKGENVLSRSVMSDSLPPHGLQPARVLCPWGFSRQGYWIGVPCPPPGDSPDPGIASRSPALQEDSLPSEPPGKPKNALVGSLSLLQGIFQTQESKESGSPALQADSFPAELPGKPKRENGADFF